MADGNGFEDIALYLGTVTKLDNHVTMEALQNAADYYLQQLIPRIPVSLLNKKHMKDQVKVEIRNDEVVVAFNDTAYYWRFVENGTANQKPQHFASGTYEQNKHQIEKIMQEKITRSWQNG